MKSQLISDPIYGFVRIRQPLVMDVINHPFVQRLRRISQMGLSQYVYPSATHSRFQHSLGAMHLMSLMIDHLRYQGTKISEDEGQALMIAILLHDVGHGPFSHALETRILPWDHERIGHELVRLMNQEMGGELELAFKMLSGEYHRPFFGSLISSQLDMDRMDYINRDSYYTGVIDGRINFARIINLVRVIDDQIVIKEKGLDTLERYLLSRKHMYLEVYLHKVAMTAERMLMNFFDIVPEHLPADSPKSLAELLSTEWEKEELDTTTLESFLELDDSDVIQLIKSLKKDHDHPLKEEATRLINRKLPKTFVFRSAEERSHFERANLSLFQYQKCSRWDFTWQIYKESDEINVLTRDGEVKPYSHFLRQLRIHLDPIPFFVISVAR